MPNQINTGHEASEALVEHVRQQGHQGHVVFVKEYPLMRKRGVWWKFGLKQPAGIYMVHADGRVEKIE